MKVKGHASHGWCGLERTSVPVSGSVCIPHKRCGVSSRWAASGLISSAATAMHEQNNQYSIIRRCFTERCNGVLDGLKIVVRET
jgi:hypothetical protein